MATSGPVSIRIRSTKSASFALSKAFKMQPVCAQVLRGAAHTTNQPCRLRQLVSRTCTASLAQVALECNPYEVGRSLSLQAGAVAKTSPKSYRDADSDALRSHSVRHYTTFVR